MIYIFLKRLTDIIGSLLGIIIASPIMIITAIFIKLESEGPILADVPMRVGQHGKLFRMYKFRSMYKNAIQILEKDPELMKEYKKNSYKLVNDPRITKIGKVIRKASIDELPQLFNILEGKMSIVGPRAYLPNELEEQQKIYPHCRPYVDEVMTIKPGLTGVWQVSGRSNINFDKRIEMDANYAKKQSIFYDLWIILKTVPAVLLGSGAI